MKRPISFSMVVLLGLAFAIPVTPTWSAGTLEVTSPNGGDSWKTGETYTIEWNKGNAGRFVKIQLLKAGKLYRLISRRTKNDGSHKWKIPSSLNSGVAFKVKIKSISKKTVFDTSNRNFRISKASASTCSKSLLSGCGWGGCALDGIRSETRCKKARIQNCIGTKSSCSLWEKIGTICG